MALIYKTLFEVKLLHEYFFTDINGDTIFAQASQVDRMNLLLNEYLGDRQSVNDDLFFEFPESLSSSYKNYELKVLSTYSGFKVAIRVNQTFLPDNTLVYEPVTPPATDFDINILISKKNNSVESYTNSILQRPIQSMYFFSNATTLSSKTFPFLTADVPAFDAAKIYQQGELALFAPNDIREYYKDDIGDQWLPVTGAAFANENDRLLVPSRFYYVFDAGLQITDATFTLKNNIGDVLQTITVSSAEFIQKSLLDFSGNDDTISIAENITYPADIFTLEVSGSNGYARTHPLIFGNDFYGRENWAFINIKTQATNPAFNLFGADGFLIKRRSPLGVWTEAPIFEIPVKSRFTFWRFKNVKGKELKLDPSLTNYLFKEDKDLLSLVPRSIANSYFKLPKQGSTDTKYFPGPVDLAISKDIKDRICFDIMVPESDLFPLMP